MTSQGTAQGRFQRFIRSGNVLQADMAARELGTLSLSDALALCLLYESENDPRFERAFNRWLSRVRREKALRHEQVELLHAAAGALSTPFREIGRMVLAEVCRELRIQSPPNSRSARSGQ